jgi:hypothetical protein
VKNDDKKVSAERFRALVETYGAQPERWPAEERHALGALDAESDDARAWLSEQRRLDDALDRAADIVPSPVLLRRVAEIPLRHQAASPSWMGGALGRLRNALALGAAVAAIGMVVGMTVPDLGVQEDSGGDWDELSSLAVGADMSEEVLP